jgi:hypothetical protein
VRDITYVLGHLDSLILRLFYGEERGACKRLGWYCENCCGKVGQGRGKLMGAADTNTQFVHALKHFAEWAGEAAMAA